MRCTILSLAILVDSLAAIALFGHNVQAAGDGGEPSGQAAKSSLGPSHRDYGVGHLLRPASHVYPQEFLHWLQENTIPPITEAAKNAEQLFVPISMLAQRLKERERDYTTIEIHELLPQQKAAHRDRLQEELQALRDKHQTVFLGPTPDRKGRYVAFPIHEQGHLKVLLNLQRQQPTRTGWAILGVWPGGSVAVGKIRWFAYVSHQEPKERMFIDALRASPDVKPLKFFLKRPL